MLAASTSPQSARAEVEGAIERSGQIPGLFTGEDEALEARWLFGASPTLREGATRVLNVTYTDRIEAYVYDRALGDLTFASEVPYSDDEPGAIVAKLVEALAAGMPGDALAELVAPWS